MSKPSWRFQGNERKYLEEVLSNGFRAGSDGSFNQRLENLFSDFHSVPYAINFNSGTSALHASLLALGCEDGDEVLTPALSPLMCGLTPYYTGAIPVYVDSDPETFCMDPNDIEKKITERTKVIYVVHIYGGVCDMTNIMRIAKKYDLLVLEDCAQNYLGKDDKGRVVGTTGSVGCWSFENSKQLTCGDGGIAVCNDKNLATKIRKTGGLGFKILSAKSCAVRTERDMFQDPNWERFDTIGYNFRLSELGAAVAFAQVEKIEKYVGLRRKMGEMYRTLIRNSNLLKSQKQLKGYYYTYYTFSAKFCDNNEKISWYDLRKKHMEYGGDGIFAAAKLLHQEPIFRDLKIGYGETPVAVDLQKKLMNFTTNQANTDEMNKQIDALGKALRYFGDTV